MLLLLGGQCISSKSSLAKKSCYDHTLVLSNTSMHISAHTGWEVLAKGQSLLAFDCFLIIWARPNWPLPTVEVSHFCGCSHHTFFKVGYSSRDFALLHSILLAKIPKWKRKLHGPHLMQFGQWANGHRQSAQQQRKPQFTNSLNNLPQHFTT